MSRIFFYMTVAFYAVAAFTYIFYMLRGSAALAVWGRRVVMAGFAAHVLSTIHRFVTAGQYHFSGLQDSLSFFALAIMVVFIYFERTRQVALLGAFVTPLALLAMLASTAMPGEILQGSPQLQNSLFWLHVTTAFISYGAFTITFATSVMFLIQQHFLKKKHFGPLFRIMPSLDTLDAIGYHSLSAGFPLLTIAIITGVVWSQRIAGNYWNWTDPKQVWSLVTWLIYAALLHGRLTVGWRGKKAALLSIAGFIVMLLTFIGMKHDLVW